MAPYDIYSRFQNVYMAQCYLMNFCAGEGTPIIEDDTVKDGDLTYARCNTSFFQTTKEFEDLLKLFFGGEFLKKLQENAGIGDTNPKFKDFNGVAYMRTDTIGEPIKFTMDFDTFEIVENTVDCIKFTINGTYTYGETVTDAQNRIIFDKIDGSWRTTYWMVDDLSQVSSSASSEAASSSSAS